MEDEGVPPAAAEPGAAEPGRRAVGPLQMVCMTSFGGVLLYYMQMFLMYVPALVRAAFAHRSAVVLGAVSAGLSLIQMLGLLFAYATDHCTARLGRRRPFVLGGAALVLAGTAGFLCALWHGAAAAASAPARLWTAVGSLYAAGVGVMLAVPAAQALILDVVPHARAGTASGMFACWTSGGGMLVLVLIALGVAPRAVGFALVGFTIAATTATSLAVRETPLPRHSQGQQAQARQEVGCCGRCGCGRFCASYAFSPRRHVDFVLLIAQLLFSSFSMCASQYLQYWLVDIVADQDHVRTASWLTLVMTGAVFVSAPLIGGAADATHHPKLALMLGMALSAGACLAWTLARSTAVLYAVMAAMGVAVACKQTCGMQIAMTVLPTRARAAQFMSEFQTALSLAQLVCSQLFGAVLEFFAVPSSPHSSSSSFFSEESSVSLSALSSESSVLGVTPKYTHLGYQVVFLICIACELLAMLLVAFIRVDRGMKAQLSEAERPLLADSPSIN